MSRRIKTANAFETTLNGAISDSTTEIVLNTVAGLPTVNDPTPNNERGYLVIHDESPTKREYIRYEGITGNTITGVTRGLAGSAAGGQSHASGIVVRTVAMAQWLDDIFDDVNDLESADATTDANLQNHIDATGNPHPLSDLLTTAHEGAGDPHAQYQTETEADGRYVNRSGDVMSGTLNMQNNRIRDIQNAVADADALNRQTADGRYIQDAADNPVGVGFRLRGLDLPSEDGEVASKKYVDDTAIQDGVDNQVGGGFRLRGLSDPTGANEVATKQYVDDAIAAAVAAHIAALHP